MSGIYRGNLGKLPALLYPKKNYIIDRFISRRLLNPIRKKIFVLYANIWDLVLPLTIKFGICGVKMECASS
jgi:hypothetical protein